jgi:single-strand DNA-binding protein
MIKLQAIGHLGKDCLINNVGGKQVMNFSVCHTEKFKDAQGNQKDKSIWVDCAYWTDKTGIAPYLKKGVQVYVEGSPDIRTYTSNTGQHGASLSLRVLSVQLLSSGQQQSQQSQQSQQPQQSQTYTPAETYQTAQSSSYVEPIDDLPF